MIAFILFYFLILMVICGSGLQWHGLLPHKENYTYELFTLNESVDLSVDDLFNLHRKLSGCEQDAPTEAWGLLPYLTSVMIVSCGSRVGRQGLER